MHILNKAHLRPNSNKTPYEIWHGKPVSIKHFRVFGSKCFIKNNDENLGKFDSRADEGIFLGYASKIKCIRSDRGAEFTDYDFADLCNEHEIKQQFTIAGTPQQNGVAERQNRFVQHIARAMMQESNIPQTFWANTQLFTFLTKLI